MAEEIWVGINDQRVKLEGEALQAFIAQRDAYLLEKEKIEKEALEKEAERKNILQKLGLTQEEADILLA